MSADIKFSKHGYDVAETMGFSKCKYRPGSKCDITEDILKNIDAIKHSGCTGKRLFLHKVTKRKCSKYYAGRIAETAEHGVCDQALLRNVGVRIPKKVSETSVFTIHERSGDIRFARELGIPHAKFIYRSETKSLIKKALSFSSTPSYIFSPKTKSTIKFG